MMAEYTTESSAEVLVNSNERIRVLHVDDDSSFLKIAKECLELEGPLRVDTANSVAEALTKLEKAQYDVIVCDYRMPEKDGLQFLDELRADGNGIPFIMLTGKGREEIAIKALNLGADQYLNKTGDPATVYCELTHSIRQVVEKKKAEEKIKESEERYRNLFELAPDALLTLDMNGVITSCNAVALTMSGYSREELIGQHFSKLGFLRMKDFIKYHALFASIEKGKLARSLQVTWHRKDGISVFSELNIGPLTEKGKNVGVQVIARDITERKKAKDLAIENQQKFAGLFAGNPEATVFVDQNMRIIDINPRFTSLFGYQLNEVRGKHVDDVVVPKNLVDEAKVLDQKAMDGYVYHDTVRARKDGSMVPVSISAAPIFIQGHFCGHLGVYKDISQLKETERELKLALERVGMANEKLRVVGGLTRHDVRNKLSTVTGNVYLLKKRLADSSDMLDKLRDIESAVQQMVRIFDFAKAYEMLGVEELSYIDVAKTLDEAVSLFQGSISVKVVNECRGLVVLADPLLRQLFYNLIDNSLKYGQKATRIRVHYEEADPDNLRLVYEDDGVGISAAERPKLFKEGFSSGGSTGYGLYFIKKMMEVYRWTIQETGESGKGARFTITIPKTNENAKENYALSAR